MTALDYEISAPGQWIDWSDAAPFLSAAGKVLNGEVYLLVFTTDQPMAEQEFIPTIYKALMHNDFGQAFYAAVRHYEGFEWEKEGGQSYHPPEQVDQISVERLDAATVRQRLEWMLMGQEYFWSPYHHELDQEQANQLVDCLLLSFWIDPEYWAIVDSRAIDSLGYNDGFNDQILVAGAETYVAFLLSNGTD
ncbi:MAG: hypothetical protein F6J87_20330 [Spirulina sp. SIO3F2]|nr:hypothetical protein [Spirulina sp. SIO3F2]